MIMIADIINNGAFETLRNRFFGRRGREWEREMGEWGKRNDCLQYCGGNSPKPEYVNRGNDVEVVSKR
jgi:hypothetical protein